MKVFFLIVLILAFLGVIAWLLWRIKRIREICRRIIDDIKGICHSADNITQAGEVIVGQVDNTIGNLPEWKKYALRFGIVLAIVLPVLFFIRGANAVRILTQKLCLIAVGIGAAELLWICFFKPIFHKTEEVLSEYRERTILLFRGILYAAIILGLSLGL